MSYTTIILQLDKDDVDTLTSLIRVALKYSLISPHRASLLEEIEQQTAIQLSGGFFQCAACMEATQETSPEMAIPDPIAKNSERRVSHHQK